MILDYLFMGPLEMGVRGAALATGIVVILAVFGILYFLFVRKELSLSARNIIRAYCSEAAPTVPPRW